jgi:hypothetical protein
MSQTVKRVDPLDKLLASASADDLRSLVKQLTTGGGNWEEDGRSRSDIRRECLEYLKKKVRARFPKKETSDSEFLWDLWGELEPDLTELDNYGGGEYGLEDHVGELLYDVEKSLKKKNVPREDRRALLDEVFPYIKSDKAGMGDALYAVAHAACYDDEDWRNLAERFEALEREWPIDHARSIYRRLGDREKYLALRLTDLKYGNDYHDLATFYWESGERDNALQVAQEGLEKGEGAMDHLRAFLSERAKETGNRTAYLDLQFAQATDRSTLAHYKSFKQVCKAEEWLTYEPKMLKAIERATQIDQLEIFLFRKEFDKAVEVLPKLLYPHPKYGDDRLFRMIAKLESKYPNQVLEFHRKGLGNVRAVGERAAYAGQARAALRMRHIWLDVLKTPEAWQACAKNVKALTLKKPAFQQEFAKTIADWKEL